LDKPVVVFPDWFRKFLNFARDMVCCIYVCPVVAMKIFLLVGEGYFFIKTLVPYSVKAVRKNR